MSGIAGTGGVGGSGGVAGTGGDSGTGGIAGSGGLGGAGGVAGIGGQGGVGGIGGIGGTGGSTCIPDGAAGTGGVGGSGGSPASDFGWNSPQVLPFGAPMGGHAAANGHANGHMLVLWRELVGEEWRLLAAAFSPSSGWGAAQILFRSNTIAYAPAVAVEPQGDAMAVWRHDSSIWASRYTRTEGWTTPGLAESDDTGDAFKPQVVLDAGGNALLLWVRNKAPYVWRNRYTPSEGWGRGEPLVGAVEGRLAADNAGNAFVVFTVPSFTLWAHTVWAQDYQPTNGWGIQARVSEEQEHYPYGANIAIGDDGSAIAAWHQAESETGSSVWANRYTRKCGWETPQRIEQYIVGSNGSDWPEVAVGPNGHGFVAWLHWDDEVVLEQIADVRANQFTPGSGWGDAAVLAPNVFADYRSAEHPHLVVDGLGNAVAVWEQTGDFYANGRYNPALLFDRYIQSTGWQGWGLVRGTAGGLLDSQCCPALRSLQNGKAIALWTERRDDVLGFWTSRFD